MDPLAVMSRLGTPMMQRLVATQAFQAVVDAVFGLYERCVQLSSKHDLFDIQLPWAWYFRF